jgi:uncharacterized protein YecE (DUF72 family)
MKIYIGTSGWQYYHWKGKFYPEDLNSKDWLKFYSKYFNTVEVNTSFYHQTRKTTFEKWREQINADWADFTQKRQNNINADYADFTQNKQNNINADCANFTQNMQNISARSALSSASSASSSAKSASYPAKSASYPAKSASSSASSASFLFSIKLYRLFTHFRRLNLKKEDKKILKETLNNYLTLKENLGPILIQFPPSLKIDIEKLEKFVKEIKKNCKNILLSIEFRHKSWLDKEVYKFLKKENIAFCISDSPRWKTDIVKTANFVYVRFHGRPLFAGKYSENELKEWEKEIKKLKPQKLFVYFNNDFNAHAIENALYMKKILK